MSDLSRSPAIHCSGGDYNGYPYSPFRLIHPAFEILACHPVKAVSFSVAGLSVIPL